MPDYISPADQYWELKNYGWTDDDIIGRFGADSPISRIAALEARNAAAGAGSDSAAALAGQPNVGTAPTIPMTPAELVATQGTTDILTTAPNTGRQITARVIDPNAAPTPLPSRRRRAPAPEPAPTPAPSVNYGPAVRAPVINTTEPTPPVVDTTVPTVPQPLPSAGPNTYAPGVSPSAMTPEQIRDMYVNQGDASIPTFRSNGGWSLWDIIAGIGSYR